MTIRGSFFRLFLLVMLAITGLAIVYSKHENRKEFVHIQSLEQERDELKFEWGRLQLEFAIWADMGRIERKANEDLLLEKPTTQEHLVISNG